MTTAIIVAGGTGSRLGSELPKQYIKIEEKPIIAYSIQSFLEAFPEINIIIVTANEYNELMREICMQFFPDKMGQILFVKGGNTRFESSKNGIQQAEEKGIIFVHDAARPFVKSKLIKKLYEEAMRYGNAIPAVTIPDSIRMNKNGKYEQLDRNDLRVIQTPQAFKAPLLKKAFEQEFMDHFTDESTVMENLKEKIHLVEGDEMNFKITTARDLDIAKYLMNRNVKNEE